MAFEVSIETARAEFPDYEFVSALTPSAQKAAFRVVDADGNTLCLKIISPDYTMARLQREIQALQSINHPNVVKLKEYTFSSKPGEHRHYLIEEFVDGADLSEALRPGEPWPLDKAARFFASLADGLAALDNVGIVHRDLKPHNIRVRPDGSPVIIDFGLARHLTLPDLTRTTEGAGFGTPAYFAPEQWVGTKHDIDHRTDLFAFGILVYEATVGRHPFCQHEMTEQQLREAICESSGHLEHDGFKTLPKKWRLLISRLLARERGKRSRTASQIAKILRRIGSR